MTKTNKSQIDEFVDALHSDPNTVELKLTPEECHMLIQALGSAWQNCICAKAYSKAKEISKLKIKVRDQQLRSFLKSIDNKEDT